MECFRKSDHKNMYVSLVGVRLLEVARCCWEKLIVKMMLH